MLFWSAVINGLLAPPLILLVILLTSDAKVMGKHVNSPLLRYLGWATFVVMVAAAIGMVVTSRAIPAIRSRIFLILARQRSPDHSSGCLHDRER
jgi:hypothetical protein